MSHRLDEVFDLCDRATVFRDGRHVVTPTTADLTTADLCATWSAATCPCSRRRTPRSGDVLLEVEGLTRIGVFNDITFSVRAGEIVGFAGLVGAGRTEVARVLFGIDRRDAGEIRLAGTPVDFTSPSDAMTAGHRLPARGPPPGRARPRLLDRAERDAADPAASVPAAPPARLDRTRGGRRAHAPVQGADDRRRPAGERAVGRQPAEGRAREVARVGAPRPHPRRADAGHRHRGQGRGPPDHLASSPRRGWRSS